MNVIDFVGKIYNSLSLGVIVIEPIISNMAIMKQKFPDHDSIWVQSFVLNGPLVLQLWQ